MYFGSSEGVMRTLQRNETDEALAAVIAAALQHIPSQYAPTTSASTPGATRTAVATVFLRNTELRL